MEFDNYFKLELEAKNVNESFAQIFVAAVCGSSGAFVSGGKSSVRRGEGRIYVSEFFD